MKILLDEDTPVQLLDVLPHLLGPLHIVHHVAKLSWQAKKDTRLLPDAARRGYKAFVTVDANQLDDPDEVDAIRKSKLHHIRFTQRHEGKIGLALALGAVTAAMPGLIDELVSAPSQRLVQIRGIDPAPRHRYEVIDPSEKPPKYWRR